MTRLIKASHHWPTLSRNHAIYPATRAVIPDDLITVQSMTDYDLEKTGHPVTLPSRSRLSEAAVVRKVGGVVFALLIVCLMLSTDNLSNDHIGTSGLNMGPPSRNPSLNPEREALKVGANGAVATDVEQCSQLAGQVMSELGGNAADASVTAGLCLGLINSFSSGIGGGAFIVSSMHFANGTNHMVSIDAREQAPEKAHVDMYNTDKERLKYGGLAVGVPGELKGLYHLFKTHGSGHVTWSQLIVPVAEIAEQGWEASYVLEKMLASGESYFREAYREWRFLVRNFEDVEACEKRHLLEYCVKKVELVREGDVIKRPNFGRTLRQIAQNGSDAIFYDPEGPIVGSLIKTIESQGGIVKERDFAAYQLKVGVPLRAKLLDKYELATIHTGGSSGPALVGGVNILNQFFEKKHNRDVDFAVGGDLSEIQSQRLVEIMKWMAAGRTKLGDNEDRACMEEILSDDWASNAFDHISDNRTELYDAYNPSFEPSEDAGTCHFSIVDQHGNAVSMTTSVNLVFGSRVHDVTTGIILNDQMDDFLIPNTRNSFDLAPSKYNFIAPGKRPLSSMVPTIVFKNSGDSQYPDFVIGAAGGSRILTSVFQSIVRRYFYQMPLLETIAYPRLHHQLIPETLYVENRTGLAFLEQLRQKGHFIEVIEARSVLNGISRHHDTWHAVSDWWRKLGVPWTF